MATTVEQIENKGLAYKFVRGSQLYGTNLPDGQSDIDFGGVYIADNEVLMGLPEYYEPQISDEKHDTTYYELGRWVELLMKANPNALESLFAPEDKIVGEVHPAVQLIRDNRDLFVTKECFNSLTGYAVSQIKKCRGLNKKCVQPVLERKEVLDFCYTFKGQGSQSMKEFLAERGLDQKYCGLVNIPNMKDTYGVYYDFAAYFHFEHIKYGTLFYNGDYPIDIVPENVWDRICKKEFFGYSGIVHPEGKSNEVRLSSIPKGEIPICFMIYNQNGYESHCKKYKEYQEWVQKRNPVRYESNLKSNYDCKNVMHCVRLLHMGKELAEGKGFNVVRTWDREFLLDIRNHKYEYEYIIEYVEKLFNEMQELMKTCPLPETVDKEKVNDLLIKARSMV
jgi:predicted nucleotidyltransferase